MNKFELGEIVVFIGTPEMHTDWVKYIGEEMEIIRVPGQIKGEPECYGIIVSDGYAVSVEEQALKKKKPPEEDMSWKEFCKKINYVPPKEKINA